MKYRWIVGLLVGSLVADCLTTWYGLTHGLAEGNPFLRGRGILATLILSAAAKLTLISLCTYGLRYSHRLMAWVAATWMLVYWTISVSNLTKGLNT